MGVFDYGQLRPFALGKQLIIVLGQFVIPKDDELGQVLPGGFHEEPHLFVCQLVVPKLQVFQMIPLTPRDQKDRLLRKIDMLEDQFFYKLELHLLPMLIVIDEYVEVEQLYTSDEFAVYY